MTSIPVKGLKLGKDGKLVRKPPRMAPVLAAAKHKQAARIEKRLRENAARSKAERFDPETEWRLKALQDHLDHLAKSRGDTT